ncbi:MAG TPA: SpoIIE family protein phosphatase [Casimicrobiaceae bacterium]|nr:SpoIIE family protein phosphatase [Casimicrobiaceae bacterium]
MPAAQPPLSAQDLEAILDVTKRLAAPFDLPTMLGAVVDAAKQVLRAERGSVWLYDEPKGELVLEVATAIAPVRVPWQAGLVGACAHSRRIINVPDCYADPRFDSSIDKASGYRTRCMLTLPLVDHREMLVGVMQVLNKRGGVFDAGDEAVAAALAAQCAVALSRVRMTDALIEGERMRQALEMAREVQMSTLPRTLPDVPGYEIATTFRPAELTGGDTFDVATVDDSLLLVLGDATGHGIAPALSVTQMQAMLRMAFRLGADLDTAFMQVNNRMCETLADDRFVTAFIGLLDPATHVLRFHSGGQGPILRYRAHDRQFDRFKPTSFPLGAMMLSGTRRPIALELAPGDMLVLVSDGILEQENDRGEAFGEDRLHDIVTAHAGDGARQVREQLERALTAFAAGAPQADDVTAVLVQRRVQSAATRAFERSFEALPELVEFTAETFEALGIDAEIRGRADFVLEELFTNMVKYGRGSTAPIRVGLARQGDGAVLTLVDHDVEPFDVTTAPEVDLGRPIDEREPGGLGLHLVRKLADRVAYEYADAARESRITVWLDARGKARDGVTGRGGNDARD